MVLVSTQFDLLFGFGFDLSFGFGFDLSFGQMVTILLGFDRGRLCSEPPQDSIHHSNNLKIEM